MRIANLLSLATFIETPNETISVPKSEELMLMNEGTVAPVVKVTR